MTEIHPIRLSGDREFKGRLKALRMRCCAFGVSIGRLSEMRGLAERAASTDDVFRLVASGGCTNLRGRTGKPDAPFFARPGRDARTLERLRGAMIGLSQADVSLRRLAHLTVCALATKSNGELKQAARL